FSWLPETKREQFIKLKEKYGEALLGPDGKVLDRALFEKVQREFEDRAKELLTPQEFEDVRLRSSKESLWAAALSGYEPTEDEWRSVTRLRMDFEEAQQKLAGQGLRDEARGKVDEDMRTELNRSIKESLGADRFAQYELASDGQFQDVQKVTQRF